MPASAMTGASPEYVLRTYINAVQAKDASTLGQLIGETSLAEIPFFKPNRLVGQREILAAHRAAFSAIEHFAFDLGAPLQDDSHAMVQGTLAVTRATGEIQKHLLGIVIENEGGKFRRLSLYADARDIRPWSDRTIL